MQQGQLGLFAEQRPTGHRLSFDGLRSQVEAFREFGKRTSILGFPDPLFDIPVYVNEFWTSKQRAAHSLHEVPYRACFKPQLPRFFISRLTNPGDRVYDPFMGRGTTVLEAALLGRQPAGCDIKPLSAVLVGQRLAPPDIQEVRERLRTLNLGQPVDLWDELLVFYHPATLRAITNLKRYLEDRDRSGALDRVDRWIRLVATSRLTGHSSGFFSVYTMPPNQAVLIQSQRKINERRQQVPPERDVSELILRKSHSLLSGLLAHERDALRTVESETLLLTRSSVYTPEIDDESVRLVVTSPPFLDTVDYQADNWLRCWFNGIDAQAIEVWQLRKPSDWQAHMTELFRELRRVLVPGGSVAFEVGEVRGGHVLLETLVAPAATAAGLIPRMVVVNDQAFTKTSHCWGVENRKKGTNTNRVVLLEKGD